MSTFKDPILFSSHFAIAPKTLVDAGLIDPFLTTDTPLFVDPVLLAKSANEIIRVDAQAAFRKHFGNLVRLLAISDREGDAPWRAAEHLLNLHEPPENGLGYGGSSRSGSSRPEEIRLKILRTAKEIVTLGSRDPEMISLMGFFEEGVGPDTISDLTTRVIVPQLARITEAFCTKHGIPTKKDDDHEFALPHFTKPNGDEAATVLVPRDIVRDLPVANDWSGVQAAAEANARIRVRVNALLAGITKPTASDFKSAVRGAAMESAELFDTFLAAIKDFAAHYDVNKDALGYYRMKSLLAEDPSWLKATSKYDLTEGIDAIAAMVHQTIALFKHHVENGNLWEQLWIDKVPKRERAAQLIYFAIADSFCIANNIDISPEANMGGGPIDFKFSKGYCARVLVELKRDSGTVVHGYKTQLEIYKTAAKTFRGIFVVIDYGKLGKKVAQIRAIRAAQLDRGEPASDIVVIDAKPKASASKRK
jgi:hypothetical protein